MKFFSFKSRFPFSGPLLILLVIFCETGLFPCFRQEGETVAAASEESYEMNSDSASVQTAIPDSGFDYERKFGQNSEFNPDSKWDLNSGRNFGADSGPDSDKTLTPGTGLRQLPEHRNSFFQNITGTASIVSPGSGSESCGIASGSVSAMFAAPCPGNQGSFLITPSFRIDSFYEMPAALEMNENLYRAGVTFTWLKEVNDFWRVMLFVSPGYASDFKTHSSDAIRIPGGGVAIWTPTPEWQFQFGVAYTAINDWPVVPVAGVIWQPSENWKFDFSLPKPRVCRRFEPASSWLFPVWLYVGGEFWGGTWAVEIQDRDTLVSYRDLRFIIGVERDRPRLGQLDVSAEIGVAFCRKIYFEERPDEYHPDAGLVGKFQIKF